MTERKTIEEMLTRVGAERREAEALAEQARDRLLHLAGGLVPLDELDAGQIRAEADTFADEVVKFRAAERYASELRRLLM